MAAILSQPLCAWGPLVPYEDPRHASTQTCQVSPAGDMPSAPPPPSTPDMCGRHWHSPGAHPSLAQRSERWCSPCDPQQPGEYNMQFFLKIHPKAHSLTLLRIISAGPCDYAWFKTITCSIQLLLWCLTYHYYSDILVELHFNKISLRVRKDKQIYLKISIISAAELLRP